MVSHWQREDQSRGDTTPAWKHAVDKEMRKLQDPNYEPEDEVEVEQKPKRRRTTKGTPAEGEAAPKAKAKSKTVKKKPAGNNGASSSAEKSTAVAEVSSEVAEVSTAAAPAIRVVPVAALAETQVVPDALAAVAPVVEFTPVLVRSTAAAPSDCVQIPPSRFCFGDPDEDSSDESPTLELQCLHGNTQSLAGDKTPGAEGSENPAVADEPEVKPEIKPELSVPTVILKPSQAETGFANRKGAWLKFPNQARKLWTTEMEQSGGEVWGSWRNDDTIFKCVVEGLEVSELEKARTTIGEPYSKTNKANKRPVLFEGSVLCFYI